ncbi:MAG: hypothetical protein ABJN22_12480 [Litorimonas sp.]
MIIRTVLDCRPSDSKFYCSILLLVSSWVERVKPNFPLSIVITGTPPEALLRFFDSLGVSWEIAEADASLFFVPTGNTLLGGRAKDPSERIMLVDNDIYFLKDLRSLGEIRTDIFAGAPSGRPRISPKQWDLIKSELGLEPLSQSWIAPSRQLANLRNKTSYTEQMDQTYVNGGVLLLPQGEKFMEAWQANIIKIADYFRGTPLDSKSVTKSNMVGLATAIGEHGKFQWLSDGFNYRHPHILLNQLSFDEISIAHMTGTPRHDGPIQEERYVSDYVSLYWQHRVLKRLGEHENIYDRETFSAIGETTNLLAEAMHRSITAYELDAVMKDIRKTL